MLCSRSASLISSTRQSSAMATSILRIVAACCASLELNWSRSSLVTPSTTRATPSPKVSSIVSSVSPVSSTASCSRAAATVCASRPSSATMVATATGCVMYGSPERRNCPSWAVSGGPAGRDDHRGVVVGPVPLRTRRAAGPAGRASACCLRRLVLDAVRLGALVSTCESPGPGPPSIQATRQGKRANATAPAPERRLLSAALALALALAGPRRRLARRLRRAAPASRPSTARRPTALATRPGPVHDRRPRRLHPVGCPSPVGSARCALIRPSAARRPRAPPRLAWPEAATLIWVLMVAASRAEYHRRALAALGQAVGDRDPAVLALLHHAEHR